MGKEVLKKYLFEDMSCIYMIDTETKRVGFTMVPKSMEEQVTLQGDWEMESLVQVKLTSDMIDGAFANGRSMRNSQSSREMKFVDQYQLEDQTIITIVENRHLRAVHTLTYCHEEKAVRIFCEIKNITEKKIAVEMLNSFSVCALFPFENRKGTEDYNLYRMRSRWSAEGRLEKQNFQDFQMEPSWIPENSMSNIKFGQVGTMPVRGFFPWMVVEDTENDCMLGAMIGWAGSWQMEVFGMYSLPAVSGGLADRDFGHWLKELEPGEILESPWSIVTVCKGDLDDLCNRLLTAQKRNVLVSCGEEEHLPIIFNEFCTTWGDPSEANLRKIVDTIKDKGISYCVIDAGWYADENRNWDKNNGDWIVNQELFPNGIKHVADHIRENGMVPGIWFEMENAASDAKIYQQEEMLLKRDGYPITTYRRRFLDLRKQEVKDYLQTKVIDFLGENHFGYIKVDYNDNIGIGCDGAESLGEGLREQVLASNELFRKLRETYPNLVIENCSSGGHRLEPSMMALSNMASFSDAHECISIPVIAANVLRAIIPEQNQVWGVLRKEDDEKRLYYTMANTFLGRMCLSGDVIDLADWQWKIVEDGIGLYKSCTDYLKYGRIQWEGNVGPSYANLSGWQGITFYTADGAMIVVHRFNSGSESIQLTNGCMKKGTSVHRIFGRENVSVDLEEDRITVHGMEELEAAVIVIG